MNCYLDTSALAKLFFQEEGTDVVTRLVLDPSNIVWVLDLARVEFRSALFRRYRTGELNDEMLQIALDGFEKQLLRFRIEPMTSVLINEAEVLLQRYGKIEGLRALDALQLGGFSLIAEKDDWCFVSADRTLCRIAQLAGYMAINPDGTAGK
jgi:predicted nucleic acid-binding protein